MENYIFYIFFLDKIRINITNNKKYFKLFHSDESIEDLYFELKKNKNEDYNENKNKLYDSEQEEINFLKF